MLCIHYFFEVLVRTVNGQSSIASALCSQSTGGVKVPELAGKDFNIELPILFMTFALKDSGNLLYAINRRRPLVTDCHN